MAVDERSRHDLYKRLEQVLGHEQATVLMEHLPPVGWADVATKRDLDQLEARLDLRFEATEQRLLATFRAELNAQTRTMMTAMIWMTSGLALTVAGLAFAAARLV